MIKNFGKIWKMIFLLFIVMAIGFFVSAPIIFSNKAIAATGLEGASGSATVTPGISADTTTTNPGAGVGVSFPNGAADNSIQSGASYNYITYISKLYGFAMKAAIALSILMVIYAGYKYLTSRGDSSSINEAKDILFSTLMGAALLMLVILVGNIAGLNTSVWGI